MIVAGFPGPVELRRAAGRLRAAGITVETRTPVALPDDEHAGSRLVYAVLGAALLAFAAGFGFQWWAAARAYPMLVGGRPDFFWTSYLVYAFECGVLAATLTAFAGFLLANRLPRYYEPSDESEALRGATRDGWFVVAHGADATALSLLRDCAPTQVERLAS